MVLQIIWGSVMLGICSFFHVLLLYGGIKLLKRLAHWHTNPHLGGRFAVFLGTALGVIVLAHTVQIWMWAISFVLAGAIPDMAGAVYFSLVTYTTLGYGDVTLGENIQIYAAMAAVTGLLNFGLSTAFFISVFGKILPADMME